LGVEKELRTAAAVEVRPSAREVAAESVGGGASDRDDPLLVPLADAADDALVEVDPGPIEPDCLADAQTGAVQELDQSGVPERSRGRPGGGLDQPLRLARRERAGERAAAAWRLDFSGGVVRARPEQDLVGEEGARRRDPPRDRRRGKALGAKLREVGLDVVARRLGDGLIEASLEVEQVPTVGLDRPRRAARREQREETLELGVHAPLFAARRGSPACAGRARQRAARPPARRRGRR
jgi:hypothetical protein